MKRDKRDARRAIAAHLAALGDRLLALLLTLLAVDLVLPRRMAGWWGGRTGLAGPDSNERAGDSAAHL